MDENLKELMPVFIGGCDRSGTTMLGSMLGSHRKVLCIPEAQFMIEVFQKYNFDGEDPNGLIRKISGHPRFGIWGIQLDPFELEINGLEESYGKIMEWVVGQYGKNVQKFNIELWTDHVPTNIKNAILLRFIFPKAKFLHIIRDGRAVASSLLSVRFGPNTIDRAANLWLEYIAAGVAAESFLGAEIIHRVKYEDLVASPETSLQKICSFLQIEYESSMMEGEGFMVPAHTKPYHKLVGKPPSIERISDWEKKLTARQIEIFENITGDLLGYLGYELKYNHKPKGMTRLDRVKSLLMWPSMLANNYIQLFLLNKDAGSLLKRR